jgi:tetratricopeptide (TPR) repeat protein
MRYIFLPILILGCALGLLFSGCIPQQSPGSPAHSEIPSPAPSSEPYRNKALQLENVGEIQRALYYWKIADRIERANSGSALKIDQLEAIRGWVSKRHFRQGLAYYEKNQKVKARREFLIVLRYDPHHEEALAYLKEKLATSPVFPYIVSPNDTFRTIAANVYKDPDKDILIATLAEQKNGKRLIPGQVLLLPMLDDRFERPAVDLEKELNLAKERLREKDYPEALKILEPLLKLEPENQKTIALIDRAYYEWGNLLNEKSRPREALKILKKVEPTYRDVRKKIISTKALLKKQGEEHYLKGLKHFVDDDIEGAIEEWERALYLDPSHKKAKNDILDAKKIIEQLKEVE